jgi:hypothetical protein
MRFQKRIKLLPGLKVNLSKNGVSFSVGTKGITHNVKPGRRSRTTIGAPGTGLSQTFTAKQIEQKSAERASIIVVVGFAALILFAYLKFFT